MNVFTKFVKKPAFYLTSVLAGIFLFCTVMAVGIDKSAMNPDFHKELFAKNDIYSHAYELINSSMKDFLKTLKESPSQNSMQGSQLSVLFEKSLTPDTVRSNLDHFREELFGYFKGERVFLPDIHLKGQQKTGEGIRASSAVGAGKASQTLADIDRINISAVLQYINRNDIIDYMTVMKFIYYLAQTAPGFTVLAFLLLVLTGIALCKRFSDASRWLAAALTTCSAFSLAGGAGLFVYTRYVLPDNLYPVAASIPLQKDVILSYISDCTLYSATLGFLAAILSLALALSLLWFAKGVYPSEYRAGTEEKAAKRPGIIMKTSICTLLAMLVLSGLLVKTNSFKHDYERNDFSVALDKIRNVNTVTQVIAAKDAAIYSLQVDIVDEESGEPVSSVTINVRGSSDTTSKSINRTGLSDTEGIVRFTLDKGYYHLSFNTVTFPTGYRIPSPFFFDLKEAGTKIITIKLSSASEVEVHRWGIAEIEILDKENKPVPGIELTIEGAVTAPGNPDKVISITNTDGIAVFKVDAGNHKIASDKERFPEKYIRPSVFDITVLENTLTRYTIRLPDSKQTAKPEPTGKREN